MAAVVFLFATFFSLASCSNFSYPRMVILGPTGVGKSSLGNVLAGCEPNDDDCFFPVCSGGLSCTKETKIAEANYLGVGHNVTLVDTPGFGDSGDDQASLISEMVTTLQTTLGEANITILCLDYDNRFDQGIQDMVLELEALFGRERFWQNVIIEVTKWAYDEISIDKREKQGYNETTALKDINSNLQQMFHLDFDLKGVFIDSFAVFYPNDELQQTYFGKYTEELLSFAQSKTAFSFQTIEDVLFAYQECQSENDCLNGVIEGRLEELDIDLAEVRIDLTRTSNLLKNFECPAPDDNRLGQEHCSLQDSSLLFHEQTESNLIGLETKMNEESVAVETHFVSVDGNLTEIDNRLVGVDNRLDGVDNHLVGVDNRLDGVDGHLVGVDGHFADVDGQLMEVDERYTAMVDQIEQMNQIISGFTERLIKIETITSKVCEREPIEDLPVGGGHPSYGLFRLLSIVEAEFFCSTRRCGEAHCLNGQWIMTSGKACCEISINFCCV